MWKNCLLVIHSRRQDMYVLYSYAAIKDEISKHSHVSVMAIKERKKKTTKELHQHLINFMFNDINFRLQLKPSSQLSVFM
jgi:hypothetical protein